MKKKKWDNSIFHVIVSPANNKQTTRNLNCELSTNCVRTQSISIERASNAHLHINSSGLQFNSCIINYTYCMALRVDLIVDFQSWQTCVNWTKKKTICMRLVCYIAFITLEFSSYRFFALFLSLYFHSQSNANMSIFFHVLISFFWYRPFFFFC